MKPGVPPKEFILNELKKRLNFKTTKRAAMICCPYHDDSTPSLGVFHSGKYQGYWNCLGCKEKGHWNKLAATLGLRSWGEGEENSQIESYRIMGLEPVKLIDPDTLTLEPLDLKWKSYTPEYLKRFNAQKMWHDSFKEYFIYLPFTYLGDYLGFTRVRLHDDKNIPKYWFNIVDKVPYPIDYIMEYNVPVIILVEGIADAIRLIRYGLPALAILGSAITKTTLDILEVLNPDGIIICLDGDTAGRRAVKGYTKPDGTRYIGLQEQLAVRGFKTKVVFPPGNHDPDSMSYRCIRGLRKLFLELGGELIC